MQTRTRICVGGPAGGPGCSGSDQGTRFCNQQVIFLLLRNVALLPNPKDIDGLHASFVAVVCRVAIVSNYIISVDNASTIRTWFFNLS